MTQSLKRLCDILCALGGLIILSPFLGVIALLIRRKMGRPVLFRQVRPGYQGRLITLVKFRTMRDAVGPDGTALPDSARLTALGAFLRNTSIDELPELWNVLRGDMSLVGPRPLLERYTPYYTERERLRLQMRPGITGWAQIHGRNLATWDERLENDAWYVEHWSLWLDLSILAQTVLKTFRRSDVVAAPRQVMLDFDEERAARGVKPSAEHHE